MREVDGADVKETPREINGSAEYWPGRFRLSLQVLVAYDEHALRIDMVERVSSTQDTHSPTKTILQDMRRKKRGPMMQEGISWREFLVDLGKGLL